MSYVQKIEKLQKSKVAAMSEKLVHDLDAFTQHLLSFRKTISDLNNSEEEDLKEMKEMLKKNSNYQKAATELLDFLRMTTYHGSRSTYF